MVTNKKRKSPHASNDNDSSDEDGFDEEDELQLNSKLLSIISNTLESKLEKILEILILQYNRANTIENLLNKLISIRKYPVNNLESTILDSSLPVNYSFENNPTRSGPSSSISTGRSLVAGSS